jgi:hypothetical protein
MPTEVHDTTKITSYGTRAMTWSYGRSEMRKGKHSYTIRRKSLGSARNGNGLSFGVVFGVAFGSAHSPEATA